MSFAHKCRKILHKIQELLGKAAALLEIFLERLHLHEHVADMVRHRPAVLVVPEGETVDVALRPACRIRQLEIDEAQEIDGPKVVVPIPLRLVRDGPRGVENGPLRSGMTSEEQGVLRVFDNRIIFQNPGKIAVDMKHLRDRYQSAPRNPSILKLFRYTKISDNAGYGMDKIYSWERLTGEKVEIETNTMCTDVTFWRPKIGTSIKRKDECYISFSGNNNPF